MYHAHSSISILVRFAYILIKAATLSSLPTKVNGFFAAVVDYNDDNIMCAILKYHYGPLLCV